MRTSALATISSFLIKNLDVLAQPFEASPQQQPPAGDVFELLLDLVNDLDGGAGERTVPEGRGTGREAGAQAGDEVVEVCGDSPCKRL
jgi:hypothetical protein